MVRPKRLHHPGFIFHVINRGNNRQAIFLEDEDYERYLGILYRYKIKFNFHIFAYCLMTNHVHLLIQVNENASISKIMQCITIAHTRHYHFKYRSGGHVWQGRFRSPLVSNDEYLLKVMLYIEQNPVRAKMVKRVQDYHWSSYKLQIMKKSPKMIDRDQNPAYVRLGGAEDERRNSYQRLMQKELEEFDQKQIEKSLKGEGHYISERFREQINEMLPRKRSIGRPRKSLVVNLLEETL